jgi:hypothetical protein
MNTVTLTEEKIKTIRATAQAVVPLYTLSLEVCQQDPLQDGAIRAEMVAYLKEVSDPRVLLALLDNYQKVCRNFQLLKKRTELLNNNLANAFLLSESCCSIQLLEQFEEMEIKRRQAQPQEVEESQEN